MKKIAISGASGLVGSHLLSSLRDAGYECHAITRNPRAAGDIRFQLGEDLDPLVFGGIDALIHGAYDFQAAGREEIWAKNVEGSKKLFQAAQRAGVKRLIFISSVSAFPGCKSLYGQAKLELENFVQERGGLVIRPGLIWGSSTGRGMFGALAKVARLPILPVIGSRQPLVLVHIDDLARVMRLALEGILIKNIYIAAHPQPLSFGEILQKLSAPSRPLTVSVPPVLALAALKGLEALGISPPFRSDSLLGLVYPNPEFHQKLRGDEVLGVFRAFS